MSDQTNQTEAVALEAANDNRIVDSALDAPEVIAQEVPPTETGASDDDAAAAEGAPEPEQPASHVPQDALVAERKKRQQAEQEAAYLRGLYEARQQAAEQQPQQPSPEELERQFYSDPIAYTSTVAQQAAAQAVAQERAQRAAISEQRARQELADYDDVVAPVIAEARSNPNLYQQLAAAPDPARWAYEYAKRQQQQAQPVDIEAIKAQAKAEALAELRKQQAVSAASQTPKTQAGATGAGQGALPSDAIPDPFAGLDL